MKRESAAPLALERVLKVWGGGAENLFREALKALWVGRQSLVTFYVYEDAFNRIEVELRGLKVRELPGRWVIDFELTPMTLRKYRLTPLSLLPERCLLTYCRRRPESRYPIRYLAAIVAQASGRG